jgi:hypothetical protein
MGRLGGKDGSLLAMLMSYAVMAESVVRKTYQLSDVSRSIIYSFFFQFRLSGYVSYITHGRKVNKVCNYESH